LLVVVGERLGERAKHRSALRRGKRAPRRQRLFGARDSLVDLLGARARDLGEHRLGRGLED
ncbi:MAG: hypothetical protein JWO23_1756, partial [Solirubrobacterales bacterium]|nr:hypothetical protein [Solirubrobacterales bacterium]